MRSVIIADTSCLILLDNIGEIQLLAGVFEQITITETISIEFGRPIPDWIHIQNPHNRIYQNILSTIIDPGEASALALAVEQDDCLLILDDFKARKLALELDLPHTGTLGVILSAKKKGKIQSVIPILSKIKKTNFRITEELERKILEKAGEL